MGDKIILPKISDTSELTLGDTPLRLITGVIDLGTQEIGVSTEVNADPLLYQSQALFRYNSLMTPEQTLTVPGNTKLEAGNVIECLFPTNTTGDVSEFDQDQSGLYMIKELCHHFDTEGTYTSVKLVRDTFGQYGIQIIK